MVVEVNVLSGLAGFGHILNESSLLIELHQLKWYPVKHQLYVPNGSIYFGDDVFP